MSLKIILKKKTNCFIVAGRRKAGVVEGKKITGNFRGIQEDANYNETTEVNNDTEDVAFSGVVCDQTNAGEFEPVISKFGKGGNHNIDTREYVSEKFCIPTDGHCFLKCLNFSASQETKGVAEAPYEKENFTFLMKSIDEKGL